MFKIITIDGTLTETVEKVIELMKNHKFGPLTKVDFQKVIKTKIDKDIGKVYEIGFCNAGIAHQIITINTTFSPLLPCNVSFYELNNKTTVSFINVEKHFAFVEDPEITKIGIKVNKIFDSVIDELQNN
ncbi:hypothetical protein M0813_29809 [Anaeramoeba flamelloides]|uniref:DUF302 domain-containing protein n=1 Tax=Anaeramoeba flamelloides TaxID=1746091 RepID=A0ABQ8XLL5_9EUKA|nr:hypothetical protein M0813_29809 [Anaeramoeba flamelloides]